MTGPTSPTGGDPASDSATDAVPEPALDSAADRSLSRRRAMGLGGAAILGASLGGELGLSLPVSATTPAQPQLLEALKPEIRPRSAWGDDLPIIGEIIPEDDVRFLLVHHTASTNDYQPDDVPGQIRAFHQLHTGPEKGWPDVAYNFFVDRFGTIWEARAGSIDGPVRGDATGGSQGFALLCSLIGNHAEAEVTAEATHSMVRLLAWLAERHDIDTSPGATVNFTSRGSNRWAAGAEVTAATISGHRDMSQTACPGDFAYNLLPAVLPTRVSAVRSEAAAALAATTTTTATTAATVTLAPPPTEQQTTTGVSVADPSESAAEEVGNGGTGDVRPSLLAGAAATALAVVVAGAVRFRRRASQSW